MMRPLQLTLMLFTVCLSPVAAADVPILFLDFEPLTYTQHIPGIAPREFLRQNILVIAHEDLGWITRDATLRESIDEGEDAIEFELKIAGDRKEKDVTVTLEHEGTAVWTGNYQVRTLDNYYRPFLSAVLEDSAEIRTALQRFARKAPIEKFNEVPGEEELADHEPQMSLPHQLVHARRLHAAIRQAPTSRRLGALSRTYANMSLLCRHHWCGTSGVFFARSLIYAERALQKAENDQQKDAAMLSRAYTNTMIGRYGDALSDLALVNSDEGSRPSWWKVIKPASQFDSEALVQLVGGPEALGREGIAEDEPVEDEVGDEEEATVDEQIASAAAALNVYVSISHNRASMTEQAAMYSVAFAPGFQGVYCELAKPLNEFSTRRWAAAMAPNALMGSVHGVFDSASGLPNATKAAILNADFGEDENDLFHYPGRIATELMKAQDELEQQSDLSWHIVGRLIQEDIFVSMVSVIDDSQNAAKQDLSPYTNAALPWLENHPYQDYVYAWGLDLETQNQEFTTVINGLTLVDPRPHMSHLIGRLWKYRSPLYKEFGIEAARTAFADLEDYSLSQRIQTFWSNPDFAGTYREFFAEISPHSPYLLRCEVKSVEEPTDEDIQQWEAKVGDDVHTLGMIYSRLEQLPERVDAKIRILKKCVELESTPQRVRQLAGFYYAAKDRVQWKKTLVDFLKEDSESFGAATASYDLASGLMREGEFEEALPYAMLAANTYSAWGLLGASQCFEGLEDYENSEDYVREASTNYGSGTRTNWYLWCQRNDRGDVDQARELAKVYYDDEGNKSSAAHEHRAVFFQLEGDSVSSLQSMVAANEVKPSFSRESQILLMARELNLPDLKQKALSDLRKRSEGRPQDLLLAEIVELLELDPEKTLVTKEVDKYLAEPWDVHCDVAYIVGECMRILGHKERAEHYYKISKGSEVQRTSPTQAALRLRQLENE